jgi:3'(2'), 5'-bisphosphate nucleotidase
MTQLPTESSPAGTPLPLAEQEIQFICKLAEHCGNLAAEMRASVSIHEKDEPQDLVTDADLALSALLVKELSERFAHDLIVSEEAVPEDLSSNASGRSPRNPGRIWYVDPIDGTDNYVKGDGQYSVMLGLLIDGQPHFGCVHSPAHGVTYYGGPVYGSWKRAPNCAGSKFNAGFASKFKPPVRLMMGSRDRRSNPWLQDLSGVEIVSSGSVGLKVAKVIKDEADVFVHLSGKLKYWDTAGPIAIALGAGLEAGTLKEDSVNYPLAEVRHPASVVIGRPGSIAWARSVFIRGAAT